MTRMSARFSLLLLVFAAILIAAFPVAADANVTSYEITCSGVQVSGTTTAPYVTILVYDETTHTNHYDVLQMVDGTFNYSFQYPTLPDGSHVYFEVWGSPLPDPGLEDFYWNWDYEGYFPFEAHCSPVSVPASFVPATITCDTPVYDAPAGSPVGSDRVTAGQSWSVNPTPVVAADGSSWTEIYVSGFLNPFVPTACVG
ncbi:MAG: hypothetical protein KME04_09925 [Pleurocapsa minor GSE-CHR-MK-17-07R]|jgi:hypothetical protein|nr:hypothetical protein [Pleurocapsa minor GSE-CHR-MK 17-07R]